MSAMIAAGVTFNACDKTGDGNTPQTPTGATLSVNKTTIDATAAAGTYNIVVTSDTTWTVASSETSWCAVAAANDTVTVTVAENTALEPRTATITVSAGALSKAVKVAQAAGSKDDDDTGLAAGQIEYRANAINVGPIVIEAKTKRLYVDWGDGTTMEYTIPSSDSVKVEHTYTITTAKTIRIETEGLSSFYMRNNYVDEQLDNISSNNVADIGKIYGFEEMYFGDCAQLQRIFCKPALCLHTVDVSKLSNLESLIFDDVQALQSIDISKNTNLRFLACYDNYLTSLDVAQNLLIEELSISISGTSFDVSKNTKLKQLDCPYGKLTSLDVSTTNTELVYINLRSNDFSAEALNALFGNLPMRTAADNATIYVGGNPGSGSCDRSIATDKGWSVN
jgi:hypothetical protein